MTEFEKIYQNYNPRQAALDEARALLTAAAKHCQVACISFCARDERKERNEVVGNCLLLFSPK